MTVMTLQVEGMSCNHCVQKVTNAVSALSGVTGVAVDLDSGRIQVESETPLEVAAVGGAIDAAGYSVVEWPDR